jgi:hypothetical protein
MKQWQWIVVVILIVLLMGGTVGWNLRKSMHHCPVVAVDTITLIDTVEHHIIDVVPHYITHTDTIILRDTMLLPTVIDTAQIVKNYYGLHIYNRKWEAKDTLLVNIKDYITENKSIRNDFTYKILLPQTIINNSVDNTITWNSYLTVGLSVPFQNINLISLEGRYQFNKGYIGGFYQPSTKGYGISLGATILKFKKSK